MTKFFTYSAGLAGLALVATIQQADAQQFVKRKQYTSIGVTLNAMNYFGDVNPQTNFASFKAGDTRPNVGISITHRYFPRISGRFAVNVGRVAASDGAQATTGDAYFRNNRNMDFRTNIYEASAVMMVDLIENRNNYLKRPDFVPYIFGGVSGFYFNPQGTRDGGNTWKDLQPLNTEGANYSRVSFAIPFGAGVRYRINRQLDASFEFGIRKTFTGYIDDIKGNYRGLTALGGGDPTLSTAAAASSSNVSDQQYFGYYITKDHRGGTFDNQPDSNGIFPKRGQGKDDWFTVVGFSLNYILRTRIVNPKFR